jgi:hypothetical protein
MSKKGFSHNTKNSAKQTTERLPFIDIRQLHKSGYLKPLTDGTFTWSIGGQLFCTIGFLVYQQMICIHFNHRQLDGSWKACRQEIFFDKTECNYGGERKWFLCGKCGRRIAIVYFRDKGFFCRHCHDLTYASQQETKKDRMRRKALKIRQRLGANDNLFTPIWEKPKGMHQSTFEKLRQKAIPLMI